MDKKILDFAHLSNLSLLEQMYKNYLEDAESVDPSWRHFFEGIAFAKSLETVPAPTTGKAGAVSAVSIMGLIDHYRRYGHFMSQINPLGIHSKKGSYEELLKPKTVGIEDGEMDKLWQVEGFCGHHELSAKQVLDKLEKIYCGGLGAEFMGYTSPEIEQFIAKMLETEEPLVSEQERLKGLERLIDTEMFEEFLNKKYPGQKRFSIEGCALFVPMLSKILDEARGAGVNTAIIAMAHRGRLNVLANVMGKPYEAMFREFDPDYIQDTKGRSGDVKYHMGYSSHVDSEKGGMQLELCANPSHLESVDPVLLGRVRAKQDLLPLEQKSSICGIVIHGDASVAGQGVVYESMQMLHLEGYETRGTIHIVINNQIGFTATEQDTQSMHYTTDLAKAFGVPVLHVNGEDIDACIKAAKVAVAVRQAFGVDVVLEIIGYRKYGHNEGDEPAFTQPLMYQQIRQKPSLREHVSSQMLAAKEIEQSALDALYKASNEKLEKAFVNKQNAQISEPKQELPETKNGKPDYLTKENALALTEVICSLPKGFDVHRKMKKVLQDRLAMAKGEKLVDWGYAEALAFAFLLKFEQVTIRLSGQDSRRGTFAHRHASLFDQTTNQAYTPLAHLNPENAKFYVYNALLSEYGVLGFEYGYSMQNPSSLTLWEAQFGDFANAAQTIIDQYLVSGYQKWGERAPLTLLLPHGYEGQGPEHSSARVERFLQLAACDNIEVIMPSTASSYFQCLFEKGFRKTGKPAVIFTPKALLRFAPSLSSLDKLMALESLPIQIDGEMKGKGLKLIFCSGKVSYDLKEARGDKNIVIITLEQLYPFAKEPLQKCIDQAFKVCKQTQILWVQEEHQNMGCWEFMRPRFEEMIGDRGIIKYVGRAKSASTAAGTKALHTKELKELIKEAIG